MLKLEYGGPVASGIFLAPKCYHLSIPPKIDSEGRPIQKQKKVIKFKGVPKDRVKSEWFSDQLDKAKVPDVEDVDSDSESDSELDDFEKLDIVNAFRIDHKTFVIYHKTTKFKLAVNSNKRVPVYDRKGEWIGTKPVTYGTYELGLEFEKHSTASAAHIANLAAVNMSLHDQLKVIQEVANQKLENQDDENPIKRRGKGRLERMRTEKDRELLYTTGFHQTVLWKTRHPIPSLTGTWIP